jgi:hypothetical protein
MTLNSTQLTALVHDHVNEEDQWRLFHFIPVEWRALACDALAATLER